MLKKRILIFSHIYFPYIGGAEISIKEITDRIGVPSAELRAGFEFVMITGWRDRKLKRREYISAVEVYRIGIGVFQIDQYLYPFVAPFVALWLHRINKFDATWAMMPSQAGMAALVFKWLKPHIPYLLTDQSGDSDVFWKRRTFFWYPIFRQIFRKADRVQVISNFLAERAKQFGNEKKISIIPNGVDIKRFSQGFSREKKDALRKKLGIKNDEKVVISTSRFMYKNGIDILIRAFRILNSSRFNRDGNDKGKYGNDNIKLLLLGWGDDEHKLKRLARGLSPEDRVLFPGSISNDEIPLYLSISTIFIRPSRSEGQGISFIEAMAAGVPVIAPLVGGIPDFLRDRETGIVCKSENPQDLAERIELVLHDMALRNRVILNARKMVEERYEWDSIAQKMSQLFSELTNSNDN